MSLITEVKTRVLKYPSLSVSEVEHGIIIYTPDQENGFNISLFVDTAEDYTVYTVAFGNWHGHFDTEEEAGNFVAMGLTDQCRLREISWGSKPSKWVVESLQNGRWVMEQTTGSLFFPFWKKRSEKVLQNSVL